MKAIRFSTGFVAILLAMSLTCQTQAQVGGSNPYIQGSRNPQAEVELLVIVSQDAVDLAGMAGYEQFQLANQHPPLAQQFAMSGQYFHIGAAYEAGALDCVQYLAKNWDNLTPDQRLNCAKAAQARAEQGSAFTNLGYKLAPIRTSTGAEAKELSIDVELNLDMIIAIL